MLIGSNNSLTYLTPCSALQRVFRWVNRCQEVTYEEQYTYWGIRYFDIRLFVNKYGQMVIKDGYTKYSLFSLYSVFDYFDKRGDVVVNVSLDVSINEYMSSDYNQAEAKFKGLCRVMETIYHNIIFTGGTRKFDNKVLYSFGKRKNNYDDMKIVAPAKWSPVYRFISKWLPFLIGRLNKKYIEKFKDKHIFLVLNYINRR